MQNSSSNDTNCFEQYNTKAYAAVVGIRCAAGCVSVVCCLAVIVLIFLMKKHQFFTQRLILYLTLSTLAYSIVSILNVEGYRSFTTDALRNYCIFTGFVEQLTSCWVPLSIACIVVDLFYKVIFQRPTERLEYVYIAIIFASPLLYSWIPFIGLTYGQAGAWCWIRDHDYDDCSRVLFGTYLRFLIYWLPLVILMIVLTIMLIITVVVLRRKQKKWYGNYNPEAQTLKKQMKREVIPLIAYPIIFLILNIFPLANRIADISSSTSVYGLVLLAAISLPLQGLVITIAFVADRETRSKLTPRQLIGMIWNVAVAHEQMVEEYPIGNNDEKEREIEKSTYDL